MTGTGQHDPYAARPWLASYPPGVPQDIDPSRYSTLVDMFRKSAAAFADRYPACALLLKGPKTIVARAGQPLSYNQTGHSGLACGGSGDRHAAR